jgi:4-amino-4-deoxy-L-arabinose transferase-like glycosyltransferase
VRLPSLNQPFENDSGATAYHARLVFRGEPLFGAHHTAHHMPAAYYLYATSFALLGDRPASVKALLLVWTAATVYLLYRLGTLVDDRQTGFVAALLATVLYGHLILAGTNSKIDSFVGLPQLIAVYCLVAFQRRRAPPRAYALVGAAIGAVFLFKAPSVFSPVVLTAIALLAAAWSGREQHPVGRWVFARGFRVAAGFVLVVAPVLLYFASLGLVDGFLEVFRNGLNYTSVSSDRCTSLACPVIYPLLVLATANAAILIAGLSAVIVVALQALRGATGRKREPLPFGLMLIVCWFVLAFVESGVTRTYLHHYYLVFVPPLTLLAAWLLRRLVALIPQSRWRGAAWAAPAALVIISMGAQQYRYYREYVRYALGQQTHTDFLIEGLPTGVGETMVAVQDLASYLRERTTSDDTIYYWSNLMELYYVADRRSADEIIWPIYAGADGDREDIFNATYFLLGSVPLGYDENPDWLEAGLASHYDLETTLHGQQIYRRKQNVDAIDED